MPIWATVISVQEEIPDPDQKIKHGITNKIVHAQLIKTPGCSNLDASTKTSGLACILGSILTLWALPICPTHLLNLSSILSSEVFCARTRIRLHP
jgi:hypothetical protein